MLRKLLLRLRQLFRRQAPQEASQLPELLLNRPVDDRVLGHHNFTNIHDILDALPHYFDDMRALRRTDEDAYQIFSRLGGQIVNFDSGWLARDVPPEFLHDAPAVRCLFWGRYTMLEGNDGENCTRAIYMFRVASGRLFTTNHPGCCVVTPRTGLNYSLRIIYRAKGDRWACVGDVFVNIDDLGHVRALREGRIEQQRLPNGRHIPHKQDDALPAWLKDHAAYNNEQPHIWLSETVAACASAKRLKQTILVRATRDGMAAAWTIDRNDAKRFFRLRETDAATDGRRKRVLHYVGPFDRVVGDREQHVRAHYRGERGFDWEGYHIEISGLGFHHDDFFDAPISQYDMEDHPPGAMASLGTVTRELVDYYNQPFFLSGNRKTRRAQKRAARTAIAHEQRPHL